MAIPDSDGTAKGDNDSVGERGGRSSVEEFLCGGMDPTTCSVLTRVRPFGVTVDWTGAESASCT